MDVLVSFMMMHAQSLNFDLVDFVKVWEAGNGHSVLSEIPLGKKLSDFSPL
jgi:hypothetical protein